MTALKPIVYQMSETKRASKSFRVPFEILFDRTVVDIKDETKVRLMTEVHDKLLDNSTISDTQLYEYCVYLWSFVQFVRGNPMLCTTVPLDWLFKGMTCNCYWWEVLTATNRYADCVASLAAKTTSSSETRSKLFAFRACRNALGLLHKLATEALPVWTDRGKSEAFLAEIRKQEDLALSLHKTLWIKALTIGVEVAGAEIKQAHNVAQMCATLYDLSERKDTHTLAKGLLAESRHLHHLADYASAIALAQAYERVQKDATHPELAEWLKLNDTVWHSKIPAPVDAATALMAVGKSKAYEKGTPPVSVTLFTMKKV
jgi:hypothetical protein